MDCRRPSVPPTRELPRPWSLGKQTDTGASWGPRDTVSSWPWISAIFRPGLSSFRSCTDISRVASSCRTASTSNSLWAPRAGCSRSRGPRQKAQSRSRISEADPGLNLRLLAGYSSGDRAQGGTSWGPGNHRGGGAGLGRVLWGPGPPRGLGGFEPSPGLSLSRNLHIHITLVKHTLVGDTFYLKCGIYRSPRILSTATWEPQAS